MQKDLSSSTSKVLIVDDEPRNVRVLEGVLLPEGYDLQTVTSGAACITAVNEDPPDIILLDVMMPEMDGYEVCVRLKEHAHTHKIPVIFVTAVSDAESEAKGLKLGAVDYIIKPISPPIVRARVKTHLALYNQSRTLEQKVKERTAELAQTQDVTILGLATLAEYRDNETGGHILRTQRYVETLAAHMKRNETYGAFLDDDTIELLFKSAPLHDIGKVGVPDRILLKPGKLTDEEFDVMKKHVVYGHDAIRMAEASLDTADDGNSFLRIAREVAISHHEKWNGFGYPRGLEGGAIPIPGRLMAIADVYDALISKRVYKAAFPHAKAVGIMREEREKHFDPAVVDAFLEIEGDFASISAEFADATTE